MIGALRCISTHALLLASLLGQGANGLLQLHVAIAHGAPIAHHGHESFPDHHHPEADHGGDHSHDLNSSVGVVARIVSPDTLMPWFTGVVLAAAIHVPTHVLPSSMSTMARAGPSFPERRSILRL